MKKRWALLYQTLFMVFILMLTVPLLASAVMEEWAARYNGPGNGSDYAHAIAVDSSGNVCVTGRSQVSGMNTEYKTVKYDADGNKLWETHYGGPGNSLDYAKAIAIDSSGNIYVAGEIYSYETSSDYATIKYDANGNELWVIKYDGPWSDWDSASAIAVDALENVYVTGWSQGDYTTFKYDINGDQVWEARYDGPGSNVDLANAIALDASGNICVTGGSQGEYATVKYDTNGNQVWVARYNGPGIGTDEAVAVAVDSLGNVYVTGKSFGSGTSSDYATIKYDMDGNQVWVARYNGPGNGSDEASAIALDSLGNVYVTGKSPGSGTSSDYATIKYDMDGNQVWVARYNGPGNDSDEASAIALDSLGNVYVTGGSIGIGTSWDYATLKYGVEEEVEVVMEIPAGWSMISLPLLPDNATLDNLFPEAVVVYKFDKTMGYVRLEENDNFEVGMGYWILLNTPESYTIMGMEITEYTIPATNGWNMIGGCTSSARKLIENGTYVVVYRFAQETGYIRLYDEELLEPGKGYWILFSDASAGAEFTASTLF